MRTTMPYQMTGTVIEVIANHELLRLFSEAVRRAGFDELFLGKDEYTVLAPSDRVFGEYLKGPGKEAYRDPEALYRLVGCHVVAGSFSAGFFDRRSIVSTIAGVDVTVSGTLFEVPDLRCTNGVVHIINTVFDPECVQS